MSPRFQRGLVVGKFAPLHLGHEMLLRRAWQHCAEVVVISYSIPELPGCEPERRRRWFRERFPTVRLVLPTAAEWADGCGLAGDGEAPPIPTNAEDDTSHRRFCGWLCVHRLGLAVDAVFSSEDYGEGFARELELYFQAHGYPAARVSHVLVDRERGQVPISGRVLRADVHAHRAWLAPEVYASFVERVAILGGESSGKTTLAVALAEELGTVPVTEFGRELWVQRGGRLEFDDLLTIGRTQVANEERAARQANRFLICDTSPLTTLFYSRELFGRADPELEQLACRPYRAVVLCAPDFPFVQDGTRQDAAFRERQHRWYLQELERRGLPFRVVEGPLEARVQAVRRQLVGG